MFSALQGVVSVPCSPSALVQADAPYLRHLVGHTYFSPDSCSPSSLGDEELVQEVLFDAVVTAPMEAYWTTLALNMSM